MTDKTLWGIHGEIDILVGSLAAAGVQTSFDELMGITGTAFRTHFFTIRENPGMRIGPDPDNPNIIWGPRYAWSSLRHNNFGHTEALSYYFGGSAVLREHLAWEEAWKLIRFEYDAGRPVLVYGLPGVTPWRPFTVKGYAIAPAPLSLSIEIDHPASPITLTPRDGTPASLELGLLRHGPQEAHRPSDNVRKREVLRWALRHGTSKRELIYETERFYAVGLNAFDAFATCVERIIDEELEAPVLQSRDEALLDIVSFLSAVGMQWVQARQAAAGFCEHWAQSLETHSGDTEDGAMPTAVELRALAVDYRRVAEELARLAPLFASASESLEAAQRFVDNTASRRQVVQILQTSQSLERVLLERLSNTSGVLAN